MAPSKLDRRIQLMKRIVTGGVAASDDAHDAAAIKDLPVPGAGYEPFRSK
jgi:hypothetical protein